MSLHGIHHPYRQLSTISLVERNDCIIGFLLLGKLLLYLLLDLCLRLPAFIWDKHIKDQIRMRRSGYNPEIMHRKPFIDLM